MSNYVTVRVQLKDSFKDTNLNASGATVFVCQAGTPVLATLYDQYLTALPNPVQLTSGLLLFQYDAALAGQTAGLDFYGMTAGGHFFEYALATELAGIPQPLVNPSGPNEIKIFSNNKLYRMKIPFAIGNTGPAGVAAAATEFKTGIKLPATAFVLNNFHGTGILVNTAQSAKTIQVGILSTETGGAASGFINGSSLATAGQVAGTDGSFFSSDAAYLTDTGGASPNGLDVSYTLSSGTTTANGFALLAYQLSSS